MADELYTKAVDSTTYDNLFGNMPGLDVQTKSVIIASGQGVLTRGTVLGLILKAIAAPVADAGNTGDGTVTGQALGKSAKIGTYTLECITAVADGGTFKVIDPDNNRLDDAVVGSAFAGSIAFTINDGATDFAVGDKFTIAVNAGSGKAVVVDSSNVDGSQDADCILTDDIDATSADVTITAYSSGTFNRAALTFGGTDTYADHEKHLREIGIFLNETIPY